MKFIVYVLAVFSILCSVANAQVYSVVRNDDAATIIQSNNLNNSKISTDSKGVVFTQISSGGETQSVIPISNSVNLNGVGSGLVGWTLIAADAIESGSTAKVLNLTGHVARVGDAIFSQTGTAGNQRAWSIVSEVATNAVTLEQALPATPTVSDQVLIIRPVPISAAGAASGQSGTAIMANIDFGYQQSTTNGILKLEDAAASSSDALVPSGVYYSSSPQTVLAGEGDYGLAKANTGGVLYANIDYNAQVSTPRGILKSEDVAASDGDSGVATLAKILATPVAQAADGDYGTLLLNDLNALYTDTVRRGTYVHSNPSVASGSSVTLLAANPARRYLVIQNNSAANVCVNFNNATLTGIVPSNTNPCVVLAAGASYESPPNAAPTAAITIYQTSGGAITSISTIEQS